MNGVGRVRIKLGGRTDGTQQSARTAHTGHTQIVLSGDTGIAGTLDHPAAGTGRRWRLATSAVDGRFGSVAGTRLGRQVEVRLW